MQKSQTSDPLIMRETKWDNTISYAIRGSAISFLNVKRVQEHTP
jgi:hypothetical protein